jgi:hypothetical protein
MRTTPEDTGSEPPPSPLAPGRWVYLYPDKAGWAPLEPSACAIRLAALGVRGVIAHSTTRHALDWLTHARVITFQQTGLKVAAGVGLWWPDGGADAYADAVVAGIDRCRAGELAGTVPDAEQLLESKPAAGAQIADRVLAKAPDAAAYCVDAPPWFAPRDQKWPDGSIHPTHPQYPTRQLGRFVGARMFQCYDRRRPIPDGVVAGYLAWGRSPTQYPSYGTWPLGPTAQGYRRSVNDHVQLFLQEPTVFVWNWAERDPSCEFALAVVAALERRGFAGPRAVGEFQRQAGGLTVDGDVGPLTSRALGLVPPAAVVWHNR